METLTKGNTNLNKNKELQNTKSLFLRTFFHYLMQYRQITSKAGNYISWAKIMLPLLAAPSPSKKKEKRKRDKLRTL